MHNDVGKTPQLYDWPLAYSYTNNTGRPSFRFILELSFATAHYPMCQTPSQRTDGHVRSSVCSLCSFVRDHRFM